MSRETFDARWLALREGVDHRSRATGLLSPLRAWWEARGCTRVLDLGCGTGSNARYLAPRLSGRQSWTLIDHDAELLARFETPRVDADFVTVQADLADVEPEDLVGAHLVTASALLDLVSRTWLSALVDGCAEARCGALFALTYDGTVAWSAHGDDAPRRPDPMDACVLDAVNVHQRRDKGLGPALGPAAASAAVELFHDRGYRTWMLPSPWRLGAADAELTHRLVEGWAAVAQERHPEAADGVRRWAERRKEAVALGELDLLVGHQDVLALPAEDAAEGLSPP